MHILDRHSAGLRALGGQMISCAPRLSPRRTKGREGAPRSRRDCDPGAQTIGSAGYWRGMHQEGLCTNGGEAAPTAPRGGKVHQDHMHHQLCAPRSGPQVGGKGWPPQERGGCKGNPTAPKGRRHLSPPGAQIIRPKGGFLCTEAVPVQVPSLNGAKVPCAHWLPGALPQWILVHRSGANRGPLCGGAWESLCTPAMGCNGAQII